MKRGIHCFMVTGYNLSDIQADVLFYAASRMIRNKRKTTKINHDDIQGIVETEFESVSVGGINGFLFVADFETIQGRNAVSYMVRSNDIPENEVIKWKRIKLKPRRKGDHS